jgi:hypothetical protein
VNGGGYLKKVAPARHEPSSPTSATKSAKRRQTASQQLTAYSIT